MRMVAVVQGLEREIDKRNDVEEQVGTPWTPPHLDPILTPTPWLLPTDPSLRLHRWRTWVLS